MEDRMDFDGSEVEGCGPCRYQEWSNYVRFVLKYIDPNFAEDFAKRGVSFEELERPFGLGHLMFCCHESGLKIEELRESAVIPEDKQVVLWSLLISKLAVSKPIVYATFLLAMYEAWGLGCCVDYRGIGWLRYLRVISADGRAV
jgi:hypothetical protein